MIFSEEENPSEQRPILSLQICGSQNCMNKWEEGLEFEGQPWGFTPRSCGKPTGPFRESRSTWRKRQRKGSSFCFAKDQAYVCWEPRSCLWTQENSFQMWPWQRLYSFPRPSHGHCVEWVFSGASVSNSKTESWGWRVSRRRHSPPRHSFGNNHLMDSQLSCPPDTLRAALSEGHVLNPITCSLNQSLLRILSPQTFRTNPWSLAWWRKPSPGLWWVPKCGSLKNLLHFRPVRTATIKKSKDKCWQGCGEVGTFAHWWWKCNLVQLLHETVF